MMFILKFLTDKGRIKAVVHGCSEPFLKILIAKSECELNDKKGRVLFSHNDTHISKNKNVAKSVLK